MKYFCSLLTLILFVSFFVTTPLFAKDDLDSDRGQEGSKVYHIFPSIDLVSTKRYQYDKPRIVVRSVIPQLESDRVNVDNFNSVVSNIIQDEISKFKQKTLELKSAQQNIQRNEIKNEFYIDYNASAIQSGREPILSIRFSFEGSIAGMAHPYHYHRVLNYNLRTNEEIGLNDLFSPDKDYLLAFADYSKDELSKHLQNKEMIADGTTPKPENYINWNIKSNGLLITFDEYQVAPYVSGSQTVLIPYSFLKPLLARHSPISGCVKNSRRCARSNILTGGFTEAINLPHRPLNPALG